MTLYRPDAGHSFGPRARTVDGIDFIIKGTSSMEFYPCSTPPSSRTSWPSGWTLKVAGSVAPGTAGEVDAVVIHEE